MPTKPFPSQCLSFRSAVPSKGGIPGPSAAYVTTQSLSSRDQIRLQKFRRALGWEWGEGGKTRSAGGGTWRAITPVPGVWPCAMAGWTTSILTFLSACRTQSLPGSSSCGLGLVPAYRRRSFVKLKPRLPLPCEIHRLCTLARVTHSNFGMTFDSKHHRALRSQCDRTGKPRV